MIARRAGSYIRRPGPIERRSIRHFRSETVPRPLIANILRTAMWAPSPHNVQPWRFTVLMTMLIKGVWPRQWRRDWSMICGVTCTGRVHCPTDWSFALAVDYGARGVGLLSRPGWTRGI